MRTSRRASPKSRASVAKKASVVKVPEKVSEATIGKRVSVRPTEGAEPVAGVVRFVGPTKFADGVWMGVELDEPKGKNDGTVQEVSYFTARPQHGLFVRLGKAELIPDASAAKRASALPPQAPTNLKEGSRVSVRTIENASGTVCFVGATQFAEGEWVGVALDEPLGKNDGSIKGVSYFSCKPGHGIFARAGNLAIIPTDSPTATPQGNEPESEVSPATSSFGVRLPPLPELPEIVKEDVANSAAPRPSSPSILLPPSPHGLQLPSESIPAAAGSANATENPDAFRRRPSQMPACRITKDMEERFELELATFEARQLPETRNSVMVESAVAQVRAKVAEDNAAPTQMMRRKWQGRDPTGFGAFLRHKQAADPSTAFRELAAAASAEWAELEDTLRNEFRIRGRPFRHIKASQPFRPEPFATAVYSLESKAANMESREVFTVLWHEDWGQPKGEAFADASAAKSRFAELDGGEYAAMMVDKDYNELKYYGTRGKVQTEMEEHWKQHFKGRKAFDKIKKEQTKEVPKDTKVKEHALDDSLAQLRRDHWASEEERAEPVVFRWELDETRTKVDKCLCGDLFLPSPEKDKIGFLDLSLERFDTVTLKRDRAVEGLVISVDKESRLCKVVFPDRDGSARVGFQTLSSLTFTRRKDKRDISYVLKSQDFLPPEEGDLHVLDGMFEPEVLQVATVWEDNDTSNFCWTYGDEKTDLRATATSCNPSGKVAVPYRAVPSVNIEEMIKLSDEAAKRKWDRKTPSGWCYQPNLWRLLQTSGRCQLEVAATMANVAELADLASGRGKPRKLGSRKRGAVCADLSRVRKRRPKVDVKCTGQAFLCKPGSRLGILSTNDFSLPYISRCVAAVELEESGHVKVQIDNADEQKKIDPRPSKAIQLSSLCYEGGRKLTVLLESGRLVDATVKSSERWNRHVIAHAGADGGTATATIDLNEANHVDGHFASFDVPLYQEYCTNQMNRFRYLEDSITSQKMDVETQVIYIDTTVQKSKAKMPDIKSLAALLLSSGDKRFWGEQIVYRCLMVAGPGTGKTWSSCQLMYHLAKACANEPSTEGIVKVPALLFAQKLAGMIRAQSMNDKKYAEMPLAERDALLAKPWLEDAFRMEYGEKYGAVLLRALKLRSAIVILDGIDEASDVKGIMQDFVMKQLVPMQISVVLTSRPEGVSAALPTLTQSFAVMSLKPLSDEQQKQIILHQVQVQGNTFFEKLLRFAEIRAEHDEIYYKKAFADAQDRRFMEHRLPAVNRFKKEDGAWDENKLQKRLDGEVVGTEELGAEPKAEYLQDASHYFSDSLFSELDARLAQAAPAPEVEAFLKAEYPATPSFKAGPSLARKLYELAEKKKETRHKELWLKVISFTDQLLSAAEHFKPIFEATVNALCEHVQDHLAKQAEQAALEGKDATAESTEYELILGPLKDPVRVHEKAADDYADRFKEFLPEANVVDVIRARLVCSSGKQMKTFLEKIAKGFPYEVDGQEVKLTLARVKNKFSVKDSDPSRFRNVLLNLELSCGGISHFVELQVHHKLILDFNETSHAHDFYDYFRRELRNTYGKEMENSLNFMLEQRMQLFKEISEVPVLLSVMTMALLHSNQMPSNLFELYDMGLRNMVRSSLAEEDVAALWEMMQKVAVENHFRQKRIFTQHDVGAALSSTPELMTRWSACVDKGDVPFVKILSDGDDAEFQFRHLSFQEALVARRLASRESEDEDSPVTAEAQQVALRFVQHHGSLANLINTPFYMNMLRIGAEYVGDAFGRYWTLTEPLTDVGLQGLWFLLLGAKHVVLVSILRTGNEEEYGFPNNCDDWYPSIFSFAKSAGSGSVMYSLHGVKSQVANLQSILSTHEGGYVLFRQKGLDLSAFEEPSHVFPAAWSGASRPMSLREAPARAFRQLALTWKSPLLHLQEEEVTKIAAASPQKKFELQGRAPDLVHPLSGPRWIFVSEDAQDSGSFRPDTCTKVLPVYITAEGCCFHQRPPFITQRALPSVNAWDAIRPPDGNFHAKPSSNYQDHFGPIGFDALSNLAVPRTAGKACVVRGGDAAHLDPRAASNFAPVFKAVRSAKLKQYASVEYFAKELAFRSWVLARNKPEGLEEALGKPVADGTKDEHGPNSSNDPPADVTPTLSPPHASPLAADEAPPDPPKYLPDVGGNAETFRPKDLRGGLAALKLLWSQAWQAAGSAAAFESWLSKFVPPALGIARALRPSLQRGAGFDVTLNGPAWPELDRQVVVADAVLPKSPRPKRARGPKKVAQPWEETLRPGVHEHPATMQRQPWSTDFVSLSLTALDNEVIQFDIVLPRQLQSCDAGHELTFHADCQGHQCDRCRTKLPDGRAFRCQQCDFDLCMTCSKKERARQAGRNHFMRRQAKQKKWCVAAARRLHGTRPWRDDCKGAVWEPLPAKVVRLDLPTRRQAIIADRRAAKRKTWQQLFEIRAKRPNAKKLSMAFFTHRLEPEKAASFVTKYGHLLLTEKELRAEPPGFRPWREEMKVSYSRFGRRREFREQTNCPVRRDLLTKLQAQALEVREKRAGEEDAWRKCLLTKLRRWRKGQLHERSCLAKEIPQEFFLHRMEVQKDFLAKFGRALIPPESATKDGASAPSASPEDPETAANDS